MNVGARINAERLVLLGWSRAILLQLAHPLVAAGVYDHSSFRASRLTAVKRLHHTIQSMLALTFGDDARRGAAIDLIRGIHRRVNGRLAVAAGPFPAGTPYSAEDPDLLLWVHATLLDSIPLIYMRVVAPLTAADLDAYCAQSAAVAIDLGAREAEVPRDWPALQRYLAHTYASGRIVVSPQARELADAVLSAGQRQLTVGLLPADIRSQYGYSWDTRRQRRVDRMLRLARVVRGVLPDAVALWPDARRLRRV
jgi:uncharacterized protein (DUF2236 family)